MHKGYAQLSLHRFSTASFSLMTRQNELSTHTNTHTHIKKQAHDSNKGINNNNSELRGKMQLQWPKNGRKFLYRAIDAVHKSSVFSFELISAFFYRFFPLSIRTISSFIALNCNTH